MCTSHIHTLGRTTHRPDPLHVAGVSPVHFSCEWEILIAWQQQLPVVALGETLCPLEMPLTERLHSAPSRCEHMRQGVKFGCNLIVSSNMFLISFAFSFTFCLVKFFSFSTFYFPEYESLGRAFSETH